MAKKMKLHLDDLKVKSFITSSKEMNEIRGGSYNTCHTACHQHTCNHTDQQSCNLTDPGPC